MSLITLGLFMRKVLLPSRSEFDRLIDRSTVSCFRRSQVDQIVVQALGLMQPLPSLMKCTDTIPDRQTVSVINSHAFVDCQVEKKNHTINSLYFNHLVLPRPSLLGLVTKNV